MRGNKHRIATQPIPRASHSALFRVPQQPCVDTAMHIISAVMATSYIGRRWNSAPTDASRLTLLMFGQLIRAVIVL